MCGIAGILAPAPGPSAGQLQAMVKSLRHRGPDAFGVWHSESIGLGHTRLKVIDLSDDASQPMKARSVDVCLTYNGEIYNFSELRADLERRGHVFRSRSDTEVLLNGYLEWGDDVLDRIEGMFAFGLWDGRARRLFLARDRAGEKPLFYRPLSGGGVSFASEIKALRAADSSIAPALERTADYLLYGYVPAPETFYRGVHSLEPGTCGTFALGADRSIRTYWRPRFEPRDPRPSYSAAKERLRSAMQRVVRQRLVADVPLGAFLSGGLDSATVVGVATRDLGVSVHTYSIGFDDPTVNEAPDARMSARHLGSIHEEFIVTESDIPSVEELVTLHDGPFADSSAIPTYLVSKLARARVTVALTGDGGDEVFGGYPRFVGGALAERVPRGVAEVATRAAGMISRHARGGFRQRAEQVGRLAAAAARPLEERLLHWSSVFPIADLLLLMRPEFEAWVCEARRHSDRTFATSIGQPPISRMLDHNFRTYLAEDLLPKVDRCSMAVALETRCPFLDSKLIEEVGALPDAFKIRGFTRKRILRDTFGDLFAPELLRRPKRGFGVPLGRWLRGRLRREVEEALRPSSARIYRFLDQAAVERHLFRDSEPLRMAQASQAWALWTLEVWLRRVCAS